MATKTEELKDISVDVDPNSTTVAELLAMVAQTQGWAPVKELLRLEGFTDPWERAIYKGRELPLEASLADAGISSDGGDPVVTVRRVLLADGWKIQVGEQDDDTDSEEEDF